MNLVVLYFLVFSFLVVSPIVEGSVCDVVPITQWASSSSRHRENLSRPVKMVVVTHTVTGACDNDRECERLANSMRNTHINQGYEDIRLSFMVGENGKIYEGAGWKVGGHTPGYNDRSISLSFIGDFSVRAPSQTALKAAENFLGCLINTRYLDCEYTVVGHRQVMNTISPGDALQNVIQRWPHWSQNSQTKPSK